MVHIDNADLQEEHQLSTRLWHSKGVGKGTRGRGEVFPPPGVGGQWARAHLAPVPLGPLGLAQSSLLVGCVAQNPLIAYYKE